MDPQLLHEHDVETIRKQMAQPSGHLSLQNHPHHSNVTRPPTYKLSSAQLNINALNRILKIDTINRRILVEPRVTMEELATAALKEGMMVPVIPEFKGITVGGAIMGGGLESASHRYGLFSDNCLSYEILLGDGTVIWATPEEHADLFYGIVGSYGSLGVLLSIELKLIPAKPWVKLKYRKFQSIFETVTYFQQKPAADFIEGLVLAPDNIVVIEGSFLADEKKVPETLSLKAAWSEWFYPHAKKAVDGQEEKILLLEYLFRHDRGAFWMGSYGSYSTSLPRYFLESRLKIPELAKLLPDFNREKFKTLRDPGLFFRLLWGWAMTSQHLYSWLHSKSEDWAANYFIIQDFCIPVENVVSFVSQIFDQIRIFPLWLCPVQPTKQPQILSPHFLPRSASSLLVNVGVYGISPLPTTTSELVRQLEAATASANGRKILYSYSYYTPEEFWKVYSKADYDHLRQKYHAEKFVPLVEKTLKSYLTDYANQ